MKPLLVLTLISLALGTFPVALYALYALSRNGSHGTYCAAASKFWILPCVPTFKALGLAALITGIVALGISKALFTTLSLISVLTGRPWR